MKLFIPQGLEVGTIPAGVYQAEITNMVLEKATTGSEMLVATVTLKSNAPDGTKVEGRTLRDNFVLLEQTLWKLGQVVGAVGGKIPSKEYTYEEILKLARSLILNKRLKVVIKHETTEEYGTQARVDTYRAA